MSAPSSRPVLLGQRPRALPPRPPLSARDDVGLLPGVSAVRRAALQRLGVRCVEDLLRLAPRRHEDRRRPTAISDLCAGAPALVIGAVLSSRARRLRGGLSLLEAQVGDGSGVVTVHWFLRGFLPQPLVVGARYALFGPVRARAGRVELVAPERERLEEGAEPADQGLVPVHPLTSGLSAALVRRLVRAALPALATLEDPLPERVRRAQRLPDLAEALSQLHFPARVGDAERARGRLAFDELFLHALALDQRRRLRAQRRALPIPFPARVHERIRARLPFVLTPAQERVVAEVVADVAGTRPMHRLLQGEVGSGKTLVAAYALLGAVAAGLQGAFMAPTEVLAAQHERTLRSLLAGSRVRLAALSGALRGRRRAAVVSALEAGEVDVLVGTHALTQPDVRFARLGLVVVDEQHKFGVRQRHLLAAASASDAGPTPHCLVMTATPIPRTLALTVYGDLDLSLLDGLPPGRRPVLTRVVRPREGARVLADVRATLARSEQVYVVYPWVEGGEREGLRDATLGAERWAKALPGRRVGLLHGRLPAASKQRVLESFRARALDLLVATVVVEVGVDVPNATLLVVEHAERFGLTQLHQLRGRVGRGTAPSQCVLVDRSADGANARLAVLARTQDGLKVAEEDLAQRGVGDLLGTRQHGAPGFRAARLPDDLPLLLRAREAARELLRDDPGLRRPAHGGLARRRDALLDAQAAAGG